MRVTDSFDSSLSSCWPHTELLLRKCKCEIIFFRFSGHLLSAEELHDLDAVLPDAAVVHPVGGGELPHVKSKSDFLCSFCAC